MIIGGSVELMKLKLGTRPDSGSLSYVSSRGSVGVMERFTVCVGKYSVYGHL